MSAAWREPRREATDDCSLRIIDGRGSGLIIETTPHTVTAAARHASVIELLDNWTDESAGALLILNLVTNEAVLSISALKAATNYDAHVYTAGGHCYLEWCHPGGWRDRRILSGRTAEQVQRLGGCNVTKIHWTCALEILNRLQPARHGHDAWAGFMRDAQAWWATRITGPLFAHALRLRPFQPLSRGALVRFVSGRPEVSRGSKDEVQVKSELQLTQTTHGWSATTAVLDGLITFVGQVARAKRSKDDGRREILRRIDLLMPAAAKEGRTQLIVLAGIRHSIDAGGLRGHSLAPVTVYEYLRQGMRELLKVLMGMDIDGLDALGWYQVYSGVLSTVSEAQRPKFAAFTETFHRFLIVIGADPLDRRLSGRGAPPPPDARCVSPQDLHRALQFVESQAPTSRIQLQTKLGLLLGYWVPLRSSELWCVRVGDIQTQCPMYIKIFTRRRDGVGKSKSLRRQEDLSDSMLKTLLLDMVKLRRDVDSAGDEDVLLGEPGRLDERHEEQRTVELMNTALRWATGDNESSYYDLRHTVFSRRAQPVLTGEAGGADVDAAQQLSAQGGHAGLSSTSAYIHLVEDPLAHASRLVRPKAWAVQPSTASNIFPIFEANVESLGNLPELPSRVDWPKPLGRSADLTLAQREEIIFLVAQNLPLDSVAGATQLPLAVVHAAIADQAHALAEVDMVGYDSTRSLRRQCMSISAWALWARAARQPKFDPVAAALGEIVVAEETSELHRIWLAWVRCRRGNDLSLARPNEAARIIKFLIDVRVSVGSMVMVRADGSAPLPPELTHFGILPSAEVPKARGGRPDHRLFMSERGVLAANARGATLSVAGLHWWFLLVGAVLVARDGARP